MKFHGTLFLTAGTKTIIKRYELPKTEEVNVCKQKLERIHAEIAASTNKLVFQRYGSDVMMCESNL